MGVAFSGRGIARIKIAGGGRLRNLRGFGIRTHNFKSAYANQFQLRISQPHFLLKNQTLGTSTLSGQTLETKFHTFENVDQSIIDEHIRLSKELPHCMLDISHYNAQSKEVKVKGNLTLFRKFYSTRQHLFLQQSSVRVWNRLMIYAVVRPLLELLRFTVIKRSRCLDPLDYLYVDEFGNGKFFFNSLGVITPGTPFQLKLDMHIVASQIAQIYNGVDLDSRSAVSDPWPARISNQAKGVEGFCKHLKKRFHFYGDGMIKYVETIHVFLDPPMFWLDFKVMNFLEEFEDYIRSLENRDHLNLLLKQYRSETYWTNKPPMPNSVVGNSVTDYFNANIHIFRSRSGLFLMMRHIRHHVREKDGEDIKFLDAKLLLKTLDNHFNLTLIAYRLVIEIVEEMTDSKERDHFLEILGFKNFDEPWI